MNAIDRRTVSVLFTTLLCAALLWTTWEARRPLAALLFAVLFAYLLEPIVAFAQRHAGGTRLRAIAFTYLAVVATVGLVIVAAAPRLADEISTISQSAPTYVTQVRTGAIARTLGARFGWNPQTIDAVQQWLASHADDVAGAVQSLGARVVGVTTNVGWLVLIPVLAFFFLRDKAAFNDMILAATRDRHQRLFAEHVMRDLDQMAARYIRAQLLFASCALVAYSLFLSVIKVPNAFGFGVMGGALEFIPIVGPATTALVLFVVVFFGGYAHWAVVLGFLGGWRLIQDYVTSPLLMGGGLELHPVVTMLGVLIGGEIAGIPGMFLSIPIIAALRIIVRNWPVGDEHVVDTVA